RQEYGQRAANRPGSVITIGAGQKMRDVLFRMIPAAAVAGRVFDEDGEPVPYVAVQVLRHSYVRGQRQLIPAGSASTNDLGEFRIFGLPPGRYYVSATPAGSGFVMAGGGGVAGRVMMIAGELAGRAGGGRAAAANAEEESYASTYYPGTIDPARATPVEVKAGDEVLGMDLTLILQRTFSVRGRVANSIDTRARGQTNVFVMPREAGARGFMGMRNRATVDGNGEFEITGVAPGSYNVTAMLFADGQAYTARQAIEVGQGHIEGVNLLIAPGVDIPGKARLDGNVDLSGGNVRVMLTPPDESFSFGSFGNTTIAADGTFTLKNVSPGNYVVRLLSLPADAYLKEARFGGDDVVEEQLTIQPGRSSGALELTLSGSGARLDGLVLTDENLPFSGAQVALVPEQRLRQRSDLFKTGTTDQMGKFTLRGIRPGEYKLFAWDDVEPGSWHDPDFLRSYEQKGISVKVSEGGAQTKELKVLPGA
ncbi:MAG: carboxypeptidase regulatory-like domain-containing protein, partial [Candidatus Acidiferrales bacterium]